MTPPPSPSPGSGSGQGLGPDTSSTPKKLPSSRRAPDAADRLDALVHDLNGLLDGSMRWLGLAVSTLTEASRGDGVDDSAAASLNRARAQLDTVQSALVRMGELAESSIRRSSLPLGSPFRRTPVRFTLGEAIEHAAAVHIPIADEHGIDVELSVTPEASSMPAGPLYSVLLNGVRNGIDSVIACTGGGSVSVIARLIDVVGSGDANAVEIEILDDGHGPPPSLPGTGPRGGSGDAGSDQPARGGALGPFTHGYTTKAGGAGVGLSIARSIIEELGGRIELTARRAGAERPGAVLRCVVPADQFREIGSPKLGDAPGEQPSEHPGAAGGEHADRPDKSGAP